MISYILLVGSVGILVPIAFADYVVSMAGCYSWISDLKTRLISALSKPKVELEEFRSIEKDASLVYSSLEPFSFMIFSMNQMFCIISVYLSVRGETILKNILL